MSERNAYRFFCTLILPLFLLANGYTQEEKTMVQFSAKVTEFNKNIGNGAMRLKDNVVFTHIGAKMYCDSAYFYSKSNSLDAFNEIHIKQGDTLDLYGDILHYNGNTKMATIQGNVKLINKETTLTTDYLQYDLGNQIGNYTTGGNIINDVNNLSSIIGIYYARQKTFYFRDSVVIINPDKKIYSDTMQYNTVSKVVYFFGPTNIIGDSSHIYCEKGWYDTKKLLAELKLNAWAKNTRQTVYGEYIYYDQISGEGKARDKVVIIDSEKNIILKGNNARYNEITDYAFMTDSAVFIQVSDLDSLFLHADTLKTHLDTLGNKILFAYKNTRFYRDNLQGLCDSLVYTFSDSIIKLYNNPVLWTDNYQISAELIKIFSKGQEVEKMELYKSSFITSQEDTTLFNQIKGKDMVFHFMDNQINEILVSGNCQTVYYTKEGPDIVGANKAVCSKNMVIRFKQGELHSISFYKNPEGALYPINQAPENELILRGFEWREEVRPHSKLDIF